MLTYWGTQIKWLGGKGYVSLKNLKNLYFSYSLYPLWLKGEKFQ